MPPLLLPPPARLATAQPPSCASERLSECFLDPIEPAGVPEADRRCMLSRALLRRTPAPEAEDGAFAGRYPAAATR